MFRKLIVLLLFVGLAQAQVVSPPAPLFGGNLSFSPSTTSQQTSLPAPTVPFNTALLINEGSVDVHYRVGTGLPVAQLTDPDLPPGACFSISVNGATNIAAITNSGTSFLQVLQFNGSPSVSCPSNSFTAGGNPLPTVEQAATPKPTAIMLTSLSSVVTISCPAGTNTVVIKPDQQGDNVRMWVDGTVPTATSGMEILAGGSAVIRLTSTTQIKLIQEISGSTVNVAVLFFSS